jgi:predicted TIM-barrel fold metal-dependent hydrolase
MEEVAKYPDKLIPFVTLDPTDGLKAVKYLERAVDMGVKGLGELTVAYERTKLNDPVLWPIFERAQELNIPVMIHTGWTFYGYAEYGMPHLLDQVGWKFPELKLICMHSGHQAYPIEVLELLMKFPNFWVDFAWWDSYSYEYFVRILQMYKGAGAWDRVLWGTDYHWIDQAASIARARKVVSDTKRLGLEPYITEKDIDNFLGGNAERLCKQCNIL